MPENMHKKLLHACGIEFMEEEIKGKILCLLICCLLDIKYWIQYKLCQWIFDFNIEVND